MQRIEYEDVVWHSGWLLEGASYGLRMMVSFSLRRHVRRRESRPDSTAIGLADPERVE
jgi:hypothetical protein